MANEKEVLMKIGMNEQEARVYLSLIDLGEGSANSISQRAGIERVHSYQILNSLIDKGAVSYIIKNNVKHFRAAHPSKFLAELKSKEEELRGIIPLLIARSSNISETKVEIYKGREGINTIFKMILRENKPYYFLGGIEESCDKFRLENTIFVKRAEKSKLKGKILARKTGKFFIGNNEELRFFPDNLIITTTTWIWGDKTGIFVWKEPYYCILITSAEIAESNISNFKLIFDNSFKPSKEEIDEKLLK